MSFNKLTKTILFIVMLVGLPVQAVQLTQAFSVRFKKPIFLQEYPVATGRRQFLVIEQRGMAYLVTPGKNNKQLIFDKRKQICDRGWEEGLLGFAFAPDFTRSRRAYIYYSRCSPKYVFVSRLTFAKIKPYPGGIKEEVILKIRQPYGNHNGGMIAFGKDGLLYLGVGDGGSGGDPHNYGQNKKSLLGKLLRIDVSPSSGYKVPPGNPFVAGGGRKEIYALGLRNPWRFSFDRRSGKLYLGDVGQNRYEEINIIEKGGNYGWRVVEGFHCFRPRRGCRKANYKDPIYEYSHKVGQSVVGGYLYRGTQLKGLYGKYIFADTMSGRIWVLHKPNLPTNGAKLLLKTNYLISSLAEDSQGELYLLDLNSGRIFKFKN